jgi:hypothetical protein
MRIASRQLARFGLIIALVAGVLASAAAASTGHTKRSTRNLVCPEVDFAPNSDNIAFNITAAGVTCAIGHTVVTGAAAERLRPGPNRSYRAGGFSCRGTFVKPVGKWYEHYVCRGGRGRVVFDRG